jgi:hypothetical protein
MGWALAIVAMALGSGIASAEQIDTARLKKDFSGSVIALRQPLRGSEITFQPDGDATPPIQRGTFARDAFVRIDDVRLENSSLLFECHRMILIARATGKGVEFFPAREKTRIVVFLQSREAGSVERTLDSVFRRSAETQGLLNDYARAFTQDGLLESGRPVVRCNLQLLARPTPYGVANGRFVARVIINEWGEPEAIGVLSAPNSKNDLRTFIATLWDWRFVPQQRNGKATACAGSIAIHFEARLR